MGTLFNYATPENSASYSFSLLLFAFSRTLTLAMPRKLGMHSAVSAFERDCRTLTYTDLTLSRIYDKDLSGKAIVDEGIVLKILGVVEQWFKPDPKLENDFKGAVLALPLGKVTKVDAMLADGRKTSEVQATLRGFR